MKFGWVLGLLLVPYGALISNQAGNPDGQPYVGQPGSTYDAAATPPRADGVVAYDPNAPLPPEPAAAASPSGNAAPATAPAR